MRRNEEIKVCCCLTYIQATSVVEITKIGIIIITNEGIQLENESWSILIKKQEADSFKISANTLHMLRKN